MKYFAEVLMLTLTASIITFLWVAYHIIIELVSDGSFLALVGAYLLGVATPLVAYVYLSRLLVVRQTSALNTTMSDILGWI